MEKRELILEVAREKLRSYAYDAAHDLAHHEDVMAKALDIAAHLNMSLDTEALQIAAIWHDISVPGAKEATSSADLAVAEMHTLGYSEDQIHTVDLAIRFHEYGNTPQNKEGEVLFDADKLTILNIERWVAMADALERDEVSEEYAQKAFQMVFKWAATLKEKMHFPYTKELVENYFYLLIADPRSEKIAHRMGTDISTLTV